MESEMKLLIEVTDNATQRSEVYDYSRNNWRMFPACMRGGLVYMWAPVQCRVGKTITTSGRRWRVFEATISQQQPDTKG
jgi:hypothetical protein